MHTIKKYPGSSLNAALLSFGCRSCQQQSAHLHGCHHCLRERESSFYQLERWGSKVGPVPVGYLRGDTSQSYTYLGPLLLNWECQPGMPCISSVWLSLTLNRQNLEPVNPSDSTFLSARLLPSNLWQSAEERCFFLLRPHLSRELSWLCPPCQPLIRSEDPGCWEPLHYLRNLLTVNV